jgi:hypothetical protein
VKGEEAVFLYYRVPILSQLGVFNAFGCANRSDTDVDRILHSTSLKRSFLRWISRLLLCQGVNLKHWNCSVQNSQPHLYSHATLHHECYLAHSDLVAERSLPCHRANKGSFPLFSALVSGKKTPPSLMLALSAIKVSFRLPISSSSSSSSYYHSAGNMRILKLVALATAVTSSSVVASSKCSPDAISLSPDALAGAFITDIQASYVKSRSIPALPPYFPAGSLDNACEVFIKYIYPGTNATETTVTVWLPDQWNERFMGTGGGAWMTTLGEGGMIIPNSEGYATALSDGGLAGLPWSPEYTLLSPGNPNKVAVEKLGHRTIHEMTVIAKRVIKSYYGRSAKTNIYNGCSTGGRQGLMEASRYPEDYDGIVAGAPASLWSYIAMGSLAGAGLMAQSDYYPSPCEMEAISKAAVKACDGIDGKLDGLVARPDLCKFHASTVVGQQYSDDCPGGQGGTANVTLEGAKIMQQLMEGIHASNGEKVTSGFAWGTETWFALSLGSTMLDKKSGKRTSAPMPVAHKWSHDMLLDGLETIDYSRMTVDKAQAFIEQSRRRYDYDMEPYPDLSKFAQRGGKILTYHGLEDPIISPYSTLRKYTEVQHAMFPRHNVAQGTQEMHDFWRVFLLPGTQHCRTSEGKVGPDPTGSYRQLTQWVEEGIAPDTFEANKQPASPYNNMCLWPSKPFWRDDKLECQSGISTWDAYPTLTEVATVFFENLPSWLLLDPKPEDLRPKNDL